jgi:hypothetical protein
VQLTWTKPVTHSQPNDYYYIVQVKTAIEIVEPKTTPAPTVIDPLAISKTTPAKPTVKKYKYVEDKTLCNGRDLNTIATMKCLIPMSVFWQGSYRLD